MRRFLIRNFGKHDGKLIDAEVKKRTNRLMLETRNRTFTQKRLLRQHVFPSIALYQVLSERFSSQKDALEMTRNYLFDDVSITTHKRLARAEKMPFFHPIFPWIFSIFTDKNDMWQSRTLSRDKNSMSIDITWCACHDACIEFNCKELAPYFCAASDMAFKGLDTIELIHTQTLGYGGNRCDFTFHRIEDGSTQQIVRDA